MANFLTTPIYSHTIPIFETWVPGGPVIIRGPKKYIYTWIHSVIDILFHFWMQTL